jgi:hypothetical protein
MTGSNHVVAGALIATAVVQPAMAIPAALASHFVMDALPHYGDNNQNSWLNRNFRFVLAIDGLIMLSFFAAIAIMQPTSWPLLLLCAFAAVLPDAIWLPHYIADMRGQPIQPGPFARFSKWIQWGERPWGIYIEIAVLLGLLTTFFAVT